MLYRLLPMLALVFVFSPVAMAAPSDRELVEAVQRQVKAVAIKTDPSIACVVVSRSTLYPNPPSATDLSGNLGDFDRNLFLQTSKLPNRNELARRLDLSDRDSIPDHAYGGGVVIESSGLVLTLFHVIDGATKIYVRLPGGKGSYADIHAADARCDLAVLKLQNPPAGLKAVPIANVKTAPPASGQTANVERGSFAVLMSNTYDSTFADQPSASMSVITGTRERPDDTFKIEQRTWNIYHYGMILQYANQFPAGRQSRLNLGISGAALLNLDGELLSLTTTFSPLAGAEDAVGYALPMDDMARRAISVLKRGEEIEYGFLGVTSSEDPLGIAIRVSHNGPADLAKLQDRDVIRQVNGQKIENHRDLFFHVGSSLAGNRTTIRVRRMVNGTPREIDLNAVLGKFQHNMPFIASQRPVPVFGLRVEHGTVLLQQFGPAISNMEPGVIAREMIPGSPAEAKFKALNDAGGRWLITHVNGTAVATPAEFYAAAKGKTALTLSLIDPTAPTPRSRELTLP